MRIYLSLFSSAAATFLTFAALILASPAFAFSHGQYVPPAACPWTGNTALDGCSGAPPLINSSLDFYDRQAFTDGTFFQTSGQTQTRASQLNWNVAGVDYPVGLANAGYCGGPHSLPCSATPGATGLIDATAYFTGYTTAADYANTGCGTGSGWNASTGLLNCIIPNGSSPVSGYAINLVGFDFTPVGGKCAQVHVYEAKNNDGSSTGTVTLQNSRWVMQNDPTCLVPVAYWEAIQFFTDSPATSDVFNIEILNNRLDGGAEKSYVLDQWGNGADNVPLNYGIVGWATGGTATVQYNDVTNAADEDFYGLSACNGLNASYNVSRNESPYGAYGHGDFYLEYAGTACSPGLAYEKVYNNTMWNDASIANGNMTAFLALNVNITATISLLDVELNTLISNAVNHYFMSDTPPLTVGGAASGYAANSIVTINDGTCNPPVRLRTSTSSAGAVSIGGGLYVHPFDSGACASPPTSGTQFPTINSVSGYGLTLAYTSGGFSNDDLGYVVSLQSSGSSTTTVAAGTIATNAIAPDGSPNVIYVKSNVACSAPLSGLSTNFNAYSGGSVTVSNSGAGC